VTCGGVEFVKGEWRNVPAGIEAEAARNPFLELEYHSAPDNTTAEVAPTGGPDLSEEPAIVAQPTKQKKARK
jgi:hypothetical protein